MTTDSVPLPPWSEMLDEAQRRLEEQRKEQSRIKWLLGTGAGMTALGIVSGALLLVAWIASDEADTLRHAVNPYATMLTLGGLVVLNIGMNRRGHNAIMNRLTKIERRHGSAVMHRAMSTLDATPRYRLAEHGHSPEDEESSDGNDGEATGSVIAMPNPRVYELGINEGERRERERWRRREDPPR